jgi:hypothetical protein
MAFGKKDKGAKGGIMSKNGSFGGGKNGGFVTTPMNTPTKGVKFGGKVKKGM